MITTMCNAETPGARDITAEWRNSFAEGYQDRKLFVHDTYKGCVLDTYERNMHDDSDFYALVWDEETQSVKSIEYATTRAWTYPNHAEVDATPEVQAKALEHYVKSGAAGLVRNSETEAKKPAKGKTCRVVKGRKIAKGLIVKVIGSPVKSTYGYHSSVYNVLVQLPDNSMVHTNVENLEVLNPEQYYLSEADALLKARETVRLLQGNYRSMGYIGIPASIAARI